MEQNIISNNESWGSIREKLNNVIGYTNNISENGEKPNIEELDKDISGDKLAKGSFIVFESSVDNKTYKIDVELFFDILSKGL